LRSTAADPVVVVTVPGVRVELEVPLVPLVVPLVMVELSTTVVVPVVVVPLVVPLVVVVVVVAGAVYMQLKVWATVVLKALVELPTA
jgi:hypothetical protein